jgi:hypothetical protein
VAGIPSFSNRRPATEAWAQQDVGARLGELGLCSLNARAEGPTSHQFTMTKATKTKLSPQSGRKVIAKVAIVGEAWERTRLGKEAPERKDMSTKPASLRNLHKRPMKPAKGRGRLQVQCQRCSAALDGPISTGDAYSWCYPRHDRRDRAFYGGIWRALRAVGARRVGRARTRGRPWLWRLPEGSSG